MSVKGILELVLYLEKFRNIDLFHQGLYQIRLQFYQQGNLSKGIPFDYQQIKRKSAGSQKNTNLVPPHSLDFLNKYVSQTFLIRFQEEQVQLGEVVNIRIELDAFPDLTTCIYLESELMYSELDEDRQTDQFEFKQVSKSIHKIGNLFMPINQYFPIVFDEYHFSMVEATIHSYLIDFRYQHSQ